MTSVNRRPEFNIHLYGKQNPLPKDLALLRKQISDEISKQGIDTDNFTDIPFSKIKNILYRSSLSSDELKPAKRNVHWVNNDMDTLNPDGKVSLEELVLFAYRADQMGDKDGKLSDKEVMSANCISNKDYLYQEAAKLGFGADFIEKLVDKLSKNKFVATIKKFNSPKDILGESNNYNVIFLRANQAAMNYDDSSDNLGSKSLKGMKKLLFEVFDEMSNMPIICHKLDEHKEPLFSELSLNQAKRLQRKNSSPLQRFFIWSYSADVLKHEPQSNGDEITYKVKLPKKDELRGFKILVKKPQDYRVKFKDNLPWLNKMVSLAETKLLAPKIQTKLVSLYDDCLEIVNNKELFENNIRFLANLFANTWSINGKIVGGKHIIVSQEGNNKVAGDYDYSDKRLVTIYQRVFMNILNKYKEENLSVEEIKDKIFYFFINVLSHEWFHAYQHDLLEAKQLDNDNSILENRINDYCEERGLGKRNSDLGNAPIISKLLTGKDKIYYRKQPSEVDAFYIGENIAHKALKIVKNAKN